MARAFVLKETNLASACGGAIATYKADLEREGWAVTEAAVNSTDTVVSVANLIPSNTDHVQIFGAVTVPQVVQNPDGHGYRYGDTDAPYGSIDINDWLPAADPNFSLAAWPSDAARTVSRIDMSGLTDYTGSDEYTIFNRVMARNHGFRTGAIAYGTTGVVVDRLDYLDGTLTGQLIADLEQIVGAGNVEDLTRAYPDEFFEETYAGRSFLCGVLFSGGDPFRPFGHMYYEANGAQFATGDVPIGLLINFSSYGWEFKRWPMQRCAVAGGCLGVIYGQPSLAPWSASSRMGNVARQYHTAGSLNMYTVHGDGTLLLSGSTATFFNPAAIPSGEAWGFNIAITEAAGLQTDLAISAIPSGEVWGAVAITAASVSNGLSVALIGSGEAWGAPGIGTAIAAAIRSDWLDYSVPSPQSIMAYSAAGANESDLAPGMIASGESWGNVLIGNGGTTLAPSMIPSGEVWGAVLISTGAPLVAYELLIEMIPSGEHWGLVMIRNADILAPGPIPSGEDWGIPGINSGGYPAGYFAQLAAAVDLRGLRAEARVTEVSDTGVVGTNEVVLAAVVAIGGMRAEVRVTEVSPPTVGGPPVTPPVADNTLTPPMIESGEEWFPDISITRAAVVGGGQSVFTYTFTSDQQDFTNNGGSDFTFVSGDGSDLSGSSAPGCVRIRNSVNALNVSENVVGPVDIHAVPTAAWETWGVPPGSTVTGVNMRCRFRKVSYSNLSALSITGGIQYLFLGTQFFLVTPINENILSASAGWVTLTGLVESVTGPHSASNSAIMAAFNVDGIQATPGVSASFEIYIDTIEITVDYA